MACHYRALCLPVTSVPWSTFRLPEATKKSHLRPLTRAPGVSFAFKDPDAAWHPCWHPSLGRTSRARLASLPDPSCLGHCALPSLKVWGGRQGGGSPGPGAWCSSHARVSSLRTQELQCDVSVEEDSRQEWTFTLYDFDNNGKVTREVSARPRALLPLCSPKAGATPTGRLAGRGGARGGEQGFWRGVPELPGEWAEVTEEGATGLLGTQCCSHGRRGRSGGGAAPEVPPPPVCSPRAPAGAGTTPQPVCPGAGAGGHTEARWGAPCARTGASTPGTEGHVSGCVRGCVPGLFFTRLPPNTRVSALSPPATPLSSLCASHPSYTPLCEGQAPPVRVHPAPGVSTRSGMGSAHAVPGLWLGQPLPEAGPRQLQGSCKL